MFLAIDTVFEHCSIAIIDANLKTLSCQTQTGKRQQTQQILPMIDAALSETGMQLSDLTALIFNRGPGAFSGIRINTAVVQALSVAHDLPCIGVSSLAALAQSAYDIYGLAHVYVALDARMKQVYYGEFKLCMSDNVVIGNYPVMQLAVNSAEQLLDYQATTIKPLPVVGNGAEFLDLSIQQQGSMSQKLIEIWPSADTIAKLGAINYFESGGVLAQEALPVYLRNNAWKTLAEQAK